MPYVVTTKRPITAVSPFASRGSFERDSLPVISRRAVATLEEACSPYATPPDEREESMRARVDRATTYDYLRLWDERSAPLRLSDGTIIEIEVA